MAISIILTPAAAFILDDIVSGAVNKLTKWFLPKLILWAKVRILAIIDNSPLIGIKNFINLLPFLKAPVYITITKIDVAKVLFINIGNIVVVNQGGRVQIIPLKDPATKAIDNKVVNK